MNFFWLVLLAVLLVLPAGALWLVYDRLSRQLVELRRQSARNKREVQSQLRLEKLLPPRAVAAAFRDWSLPADVVETIHDLIQTRRPRNLVELGAGASSAIWGHSLERAGGGQAHCLEQEERFHVAIAESVKEQGLESRVRVLHAPLSTWSLKGEAWSWYPPAAIEAIPASIDFLIVDGPPANTRSLARYPALPVLWDRLADGAVIVLHDADGPDEREIVRRWLSEFSGLEKIGCGEPPDTVVLRKAAGGQRT